MFDISEKNNVRVYDYRASRLTSREFCTLKLNVHICVDIPQRDKALQKNARPLRRHVPTDALRDTETRRVIASLAHAAGGAAAAHLGAGGSLGRVRRHFVGVGHIPSLAYRLESCPPDRHDARAR